RQRNDPWCLHQVGAGPFAGDLEQHPSGHVLDDLVVEIGAGSCLGDFRAGCYGTDLPGDQLTGTLPVEVHAGRSELLQEHVDLAVEPRTSRHAASLGERDKLGGGYAASATGSGAWSRPVPAAEVAVELVVEDAGADLQQEV